MPDNWVGPADSSLVVQYNSQHTFLETQLGLYLYDAICKQFMYNWDIAWVLNCLHAGSMTSSHAC